MGNYLTKTGWIIVIIMIASIVTWIVGLHLLLHTAEKEAKIEYIKDAFENNALHEVPNAKVFKDPFGNDVVVMIEDKVYIVSKDK